MNIFISQLRSKSPNYELRNSKLDRKTQALNQDGQGRIMSAGDKDNEKIPESILKRDIQGSSAVRRTVMSGSSN